MTNIVSAWEAAPLPPPNVVDMRFGRVRLTICSDVPLPSEAWNDIGYAARQVEKLAESIDARMAPPSSDETTPDDYVE